MKTFFKFFLFIAVLFSAALASYYGMGNHPLRAFVLRGTGKTVEAYQLDIPLNRAENKVHTIPLNVEQRDQASEILAQMDEKHLVVFSKQFGKWAFAAGMPHSEEGWPWYLGGGIKSFFSDNPETVLDNLTWPDRAFLALWTSNPPPAPYRSSEIQIEDLGHASFGAPRLTEIPSVSPTPVGAGPVRVEILNGCGITNAADWVARRFKGPGIVITDTGNADRFHYPETIVRTGLGLPVALEEAMGRLGLPKDRLEDATAPNPLVDVVVIVGMDYPKLRERRHGRLRH